MSHYTSMRTKIVSQPHLVKALHAVGFDEVLSFEIAQPLVGYQGDQRNQSAEVIVRRKHLGAMSNDLGFKRQADGRFEMTVSDYDAPRFDVRWREELTRQYAYAVTVDALAAQQFEMVGQSAGADKSVRLTLRRMV